MPHPWGPGVVENVWFWGTRLCRGMYCALQPKGRRFESTSSHCVATLDKLLTHNLRLHLCEEGNGKPPHSSPGGVKATEYTFGQRIICGQSSQRQFTFRPSAATPIIFIL